MSRRFHRKERLPALTEINVTPLIDMAFALLIIFMISAPLLEQSIDIDLPVESPQPLTHERITFHTIAIDRDGQYFWDGRPLTREQLGIALDGVAAETDLPVISIRGDSARPYQDIIAVIDMLRQRELSRISLETQAD